MKKDTITSLTKNFESFRHEENWVEFWYARELQKLLWYDKWENFNQVIEKAKIACYKSKQSIEDHFADVRKMVSLGSEAKRGVEDYKLSRYSCYLIAQNWDPRKEVIAFAMSYFAFQTRKQELLEKRIEEIERIVDRDKLTSTEKEFSRLIYEAWVDKFGFARIRNSWDTAFFWWNTTKSMKKILKIPSSRAIADFLPSITIKAKDFATEITNFNIKKNSLNKESKITNEHVKNNKNVRNLLLKEKIVPEKLPKEEDIQKIKRKLFKQDKAIIKQSKI